MVVVVVADVVIIVDEMVGIIQQVLSMKSCILGENVDGRYLIEVVK